MIIYAYKGKSWISKLIRLQTRSDYSHIAAEIDGDPGVFEAWHVGGVTKSLDFKELHTKGTEVDVYIVDGQYNQARVKQFLDDQLGKNYDFKAIARFLNRRDHAEDNKWFCSELIFAALREGNLPLLKRVPASHVSPRDIVLSPYLRYVETMVC